MKIAVVTEDGKTIHAHFGQAPYYQVLTIENNQIIARDQREKPSHKHGAHGDHQHTGPDTHAQGMADVIADCQVLITGGMGQPAFAAVQAAGIEPVVTDQRSIDEAVSAYLRGELKHQSNRVHH